MAELANGTLEERHGAETVYLLLKRAYEILDAGMAPGRVARWFEVHLADELGVRPEVDRCVECGRLLEADERYRWMPPLGGVLCERCPGPPFERAGLTLDGAEAPEGLPAPGRRGARRAPGPTRDRARGRARDARVPGLLARSTARGRWPSWTRFGRRRRGRPWRSCREPGRRAAADRDGGGPRGGARAARRATRARSSSSRASSSRSPTRSSIPRPAPATGRCTTATRPSGSR